MLQLNQINPAQNPLYTLGSRAISFRLLDQNRRALGKLSDIRLLDLVRTQPIAEQRLKAAGPQQQADQLAIPLMRAEEDFLVIAAETACVGAFDTQAADAFHDAGRIRAAIHQITNCNQ